MLSVTGILGLGKSARRAVMLQRDEEAIAVSPGRGRAALGGPSLLCPLPAGSDYV